MSSGFSELIWETESEIKEEYWPGAIAWADKNHNNAWSNAIDLFEAALTEALRTKDYSYLRKAGDQYKRKILVLLEWYKKARQMNDKEEFLSSLKKDEPYAK